VPEDLILDSEFLDSNEEINYSSKTMNETVSTLYPSWLAEPNQKIA